ncbi:MAG: protein kinase domain-containing protein, partial [Alsobacter sp.]
IGRPRITDFGLAKLTDDDSQLTLSGSAAGSPAYMSPEQAQHGGSTALSDVYGLGAVLYAALTGRPPFQGETIAAVLEQVGVEEPLPPRRLNGSIPRDLETICLKALEKTPARRYATARDFADDLARFIEGKTVLARPVGWSGKLMRWASRRPALAASLALAVLALITAVVVAAISAIHIKEAGDRAIASAAAEKSQAHEARLRATRLHIAEAVRRQEDGDLIGALPSLVAALRSGMDDPVEREEHTLRLAAALHQCPRLLHHWTLNSWHDKRDAALVSPGRVYAADFSPDGKWIAAATGNTRFFLWNTETGEDAGADFPEQGQVQYVRFSSDGRRLLTGTAADTITLWDVATKTAVISNVSHALNGWHPASLLPPLMTADGSLLIRAEPGKKPESGAYLVFTDGKTNPIPLRIGTTVRALGISGDGSLIAVGSTDGNVTLHDATTGQSSGAGFRVKGSVRGLSFSPDKKLLGVICGDNDAQIWQLDTLTAVGAPANHLGVIYDLNWSPGGTHLATAAFGERTSILMRADTGAADVVIRQRMGIRSAIFNAAGTLITAGFDNAARFFDPLTGHVS